MFATKVLRAKPLEVVMPTAVVGVRGTHYCVALDADADRRTHSEVLEGLVRFDIASLTSGADLHTGFGTASDANSKAAIVAPLPAAPDLSSLPALFERPILQFAVPVTDASLRVQVAADASFERIVSDQRVTASTDVRIAGLDDANWFLCVRRIDTQGIEGFDNVQPFVLKARPEPPAYRAPRASTKQSVGAIEFAWAANADAPRVHVQVAEDAAFTRLVQDKDNLDAATLSAEIAKPGTYTGGTPACGEVATTVRSAMRSALSCGRCPSHRSAGSRRMARVCFLPGAAAPRIDSGSSWPAMRSSGKSSQPPT